MLNNCGTPEELIERKKLYRKGGLLNVKILVVNIMKVCALPCSVLMLVSAPQPGDDMHPTLQEVPEECVREILKRLDNHNDIRVRNRLSPVSFTHPLVPLSS